MNISSAFFFISKVLLCSIILIGFQSNLNSKRGKFSVDKNEGHSHSFSISDAFNYLLDSSVEHDHHHNEHADNQNDSTGHSHEHSHNLNKVHVGYDLLPAKPISMVLISSESNYISKPLLPFYGSYNFRIFRPPIA